MGNSETAKRVAAELLEKNPNHFRDISKMAKKPRGGKNSPGSFNAETGRLAGKKSALRKKEKKGGV